jgi:hypothetical protein
MKEPEELNENRTERYQGHELSIDNSNPLVTV